MGDVHPQGNPHYWLDPDNGRQIGKDVAARLAELDPPNAALYQQRQQAFDAKMVEAAKRWDGILAPYKGTKIVTYHRSWSSFVDHFGLEVIDYVEPRPGIPPSPGHTLDLIRVMRDKGVKVILVEPYFDLKTPNSIARETRAQVLVLPPSVGGDKGIDDYVGLFDHDVQLLADALKAARSH
jgi:ABC-type Zn uptake system ZnuABC Zn-binding protein ZnuA